MFSGLILLLACASDLQHKFIEYEVFEFKIENSNNEIFTGIYDLDSFFLWIFYQDQVLSTMQQKLDCLCERLNSVKDQSGANADLPFHEVLGSDKTKFVDCGCWLCDEHHNLFNKLTVRIHFITS